MAKPYWIYFQKIGTQQDGFLSVAEVSKEIPFEIKRVYWIYSTPEKSTRGGHAHKKGEQVFMVVCGGAKVTLETREGEKFTYLLNDPSMGLYVPGNVWRTVEMEDQSVLISLTSTFYEEDNYIRDYSLFRNK